VKNLTITPFKGYAFFTTVYFSILFLVSQLKLDYSTDFYDTMISSINVSMDILYFTGIFWCLMMAISGISVVAGAIRNKKLALDLHSVLFVLSSSLVSLQYCCSQTESLAAV